MPYVLACLYYSASSRDYLSFITSSLEAFEWETYCMKHLELEAFQSLGTIMLLRTSESK